MRRQQHLIICFLIGVLALALFGFLIHGIGPEGGLIPFDHEVSQFLEGNGKQHPEARRVFRVVTNFGGPAVLGVVALAVIVVLVKKRQHLLALLWLMAVVGGAALNEALKHTFQRQRPVFHPPILSPKSWSFPSGHSMNSLVFYGLLAYLIVVAMPQRPLRRVIAVGLVFLARAIGFSRIYLGAHWPTDVLGGFAEAIVWLSGWIAIIETVRRRKN